MYVRSLIAWFLQHFSYVFFTPMISDWWEWWCHDSLLWMSVEVGVKKFHEDGRGMRMMKVLFVSWDDDDSDGKRTSVEEGTGAAFQLFSSCWSLSFNLMLSSLVSNWIAAPSFLALKLSSRIYPEHGEREREKGRSSQRMLSDGRTCAESERLLFSVTARPKNFKGEAPGAREE